MRRGLKRRREIEAEEAEARALGIPAPGFGLDANGLLDAVAARVGREEGYAPGLGLGCPV